MHPRGLTPSLPDRYGFYFKKDDFPLRDRLLRRRAQVTLDLCIDDFCARSLLEIGPGLGHVAEVARDRGWVYHAIEASQPAVDVLRSRGYTVQLGMVPPLPTLPQAFDLIFVSHLVEHLPSGDSVLELVSALRGQLAPRGRLCLVFPDFLDDPRDFWDVDYTHCWPSTSRRLRQVFADAGLVVRSETRMRATVAGRREIALAPARWLLAPPARGSTRLAAAAFRARVFLLREILIVAESP
jgi:SAM-dependent methyltransferase